MRAFLLLLPSVPALVLAGCESCEFTYGPGIAHIDLESSVTPIAPVVTVCDQTEDVDAGACESAIPCDVDAGSGSGYACMPAPDGGVRPDYATSVRYVGLFGCNTGPFVVKVTADNCDPVTMVLHGGDQVRHVVVPLSCR